MIHGLINLLIGVLLHECGARPDISIHDILEDFFSAN
jgi:hypothetical protein